MKRRVASLPPVSAHVFDQKVIDRRAETAVMASAKGSTCETCKLVSINYPSDFRHIDNLMLAKPTLLRVPIDRTLCQKNTRKMS